MTYCYPCCLLLCVIDRQCSCNHQHLSPLGDQRICCLGGATFNQNYEITIPGILILIFYRFLLLSIYMYMIILLLVKSVSTKILSFTICYSHVTVKAYGPLIIEEPAMFLSLKLSRFFLKGIFFLFRNYSNNEL